MSTWSRRALLVAAILGSIGVAGVSFVSCSRWLINDVDKCHNSRSLAEANRSFARDVRLLSPVLHRVAPGIQKTRPDPYSCVEDPTLSQYLVVLGQAEAAVGVQSALLKGGDYTRCGRKLCPKANTSAVSTLIIYGRNQDLVVYMTVRVH